MLLALDGDVSSLCRLEHFKFRTAESLACLSRRTDRAMILDQQTAAVGLCLDFCHVPLAGSEPGQQADAPSEACERPQHPAITRHERVLPRPAV
jgi:hypothetical protein